MRPTKKVPVETDNYECVVAPDRLSYSETKRLFGSRSGDGSHYHRDSFCDSSRPNGVKPVDQSSSSFQIHEKRRYDSILDYLVLYAIDRYISRMIYVKAVPRYIGRYVIWTSEYHPAVRTSQSHVSRSLYCFPTRQWEDQSLTCNFYRCIDNVDTTLGKLSWLIDLFNQRASYYTFADQTKSPRDLHAIMAQYLSVMARYSGACITFDASSNEFCYFRLTYPPVVNATSWEKVETVSSGTYVMHPYVTNATLDAWNAVTDTTYEESIIAYNKAVIALNTKPPVDVKGKGTIGYGSSMSTLGLNVALWRKTQQIIMDIEKALYTLQRYSNILAGFETLCAFAMRANPLAKGAALIEIIGNIAGYALAWQFAVKPILDLAVTLSQVFAESQGSDPVARSFVLRSCGKHEREFFSMDSGEVVVDTPAPFEGDIQVWFNSSTAFSVKASCYVNITANVIFQSADTDFYRRCGLLTPTTVFWQIVPFSFLFDWLLDLGHFIQDWELNKFGLIPTVVDGTISTSVRTVRTATQQETYIPEKSSYNPYGETSHRHVYCHTSTKVHRNVISSWPEQEYIPFNNRINPSMALSLIEIIITNLSPFAASKVRSIADFH